MQRRLVGFAVAQIKEATDFLELTCGAGGGGTGAEARNAGAIDDASILAL